MARRKDFIPESGPGFDEWQAGFVDRVNELAGELDLLPGQRDALNAAHAVWQAAWQAHLAVRDTARAATVAKNEARTELKKNIRQVSRRIQTHPDTVDRQRAHVGITVPDRTRTRLSADAITQVPAPLLRVDHSVAGQTVIHFGPNPRDERRNGIPKGAWAADIRFSIGGIPKDESRWKRLALDKHSPYVHKVAPGTRVAYRARWIDRLGRPGPFGSPTEVIVSV